MPNKAKGNKLLVDNAISAAEELVSEMPDADPVNQYICHLYSVTHEDPEDGEIIQPECKDGHSCVLRPLAEPCCLTTDRRTYAGELFVRSEEAIGLGVLSHLSNNGFPVKDEICADGREELSHEVLADAPEARAQRCGASNGRSIFDPAYVEARLQMSLGKQSTGGRTAECKQCMSSDPGLPGFTEGSTSNPFTVGAADTASQKEKTFIDRWEEVLQDQLENWTVWFYDLEYESLHLLLKLFRERVWIHFENAWKSLLRFFGEVAPNDVANQGCFKNDKLRKALLNANGTAGD